MSNILLSLLVLLVTLCHSLWKFTQTFNALSVPLLLNTKLSQFVFNDLIRHERVCLNCAFKPQVLEVVLGVFVDVFCHEFADKAVFGGPCLFKSWAIRFCPYETLSDVFEGHSQHREVAQWTTHVTILSSWLKRLNYRNGSSLLFLRVWCSLYNLRLNHLLFFIFLLLGIYFWLRKNLFNLKDSVKRLGVLAER